MVQQTTTLRRSPSIPDKRCEETQRLYFPPPRRKRKPPFFYNCNQPEAGSLQVYVCRPYRRR